MSKPRTILVTFAGRRDRMELLTRYVEAALGRGLIDEWHVWLFARNEPDRLWLSERFPVAQATPNHSTDYFRLPAPFALRGDAARLGFSVRAPHDAHVALKRLSGEGASYELVLGGWSNQFSALRRFEDPREVEDLALRDPARPADFAVASPGLLPEFGFSDVTIQLGAEGLHVFFRGAPLISDPAPVPPGEFAVLYRTGHGANGDWRFPDFVDHRARLFVTGPEPHFPANALFYNQAYQYYIANQDAYRNDVILKCDDDIVHFDLEALRDFISFRRDNPQYFLVSANVINNGVCAHFQQAMGAIPKAAMVCEAPPGGLCGALWSDGAKAETLHRLFCAAPDTFRAPPSSAPIVWNERISINFIALLGADLVHIPDVATDDEHDLCYGVRKRAKKQNCIYPQFVASHLSFWKQDAEMNIGATLRGYEALAMRLGLPAPQPLQDAAAA